jgi:tetratricopeptide (TPR) repeat protein
MSDSVIKGERKASARPSASSHNSTSTARGGKQASETARPAKLSARPAAAKPPAQKAIKQVVEAAAKTPATKSSDTAKSLKKPAPSVTAAKSASAKPSAKTSTQSNQPVKPAQSKSALKSASSAARDAVRPSAPKTSGVKPAAPAKTEPAKKSRAATPAATPSKSAPPDNIVRGKTRDEASALDAFKKAHQEFARGRFAQAVTQFRSIIERFPGVAEVTARSRTYLNIAESRMNTERGVPANADALYDRGVIELNRANYVAAQELFERALQQDASAAHVLYGLAATRARLGSRTPAFEVLERAIELQPTLRLRVTQDSDFSSLRGDAEFERIVFNSRA